MRLFRLLILFFSLTGLSPISADLLFESDAVLDIELTGPIDTLIENKNDRTDYPFVLHIDGKDHNIMVRARGKSRLRVCDFPPLRFNFETGDMSQTDFAGLSKLKLVTHCRNGPKNEYDVLEEYAAYRIFMLLSNISYRVRLLRLTYIDTDQRLKNVRPRYAFAIEPQEHVAERVGGTRLNVTGVRKSELNNNQAAIVYVFQYLIGNTDWSFVLAENDDECCHNGDLIKIGEEIFYVPYDFDLAGIVNARYAKPDPSLKLKNVRLRRYRGYCTDRQTLHKAIRFVKAQKSEVLDVAQTLPGLSSKQTDKVVDYLDKFFDRAEDEESLLKEYERRCLG